MSEDAVEGSESEILVLAVLSNYCQATSPGLLKQEIEVRMYEGVGLPQEYFYGVHFLRTPVKMPL